jgi:mannose-6-phosphate isomerase-like protein (cupin superfamily)
MWNKKIYLCGMMACLAAVPCLAQSPGVQSVSSEQMTATESALRAEAERTHKPALKQLEKSDGFYTSLIYRNATGEVEIHTRFDEIVVVVDGEATVKTGGKPIAVRTIAPGELRGKSAEGASPTSLRQNAVVTIPAGTPHQVIVPDGGHVTYLDVKIEHGRKNAAPR